MKFSQRIGKTPVRDVLQTEGMDRELSNSLWNTILEQFIHGFDTYAHRNHSERGYLFENIWRGFFKNPINDLPTTYDGEVQLAWFEKYLHQWWEAAEWFDKYDFLEYLVGLDIDVKSEMLAACANVVLEVEHGAYRFTGDKLIQVTSEEELKEIENALSSQEKSSPVKIHLLTAIDLLADRKNPNYRNVAKESISAVESLCKIITGDSNATLGKALSIVEKKHQIHPAFKQGLSSIYGYTSDASGIRHGLLEGDSPVAFEDAKFMLVMCSAFINYLKAKTL